jgi:Tol biopolymer transport system component
MGRRVAREVTEASLAGRHDSRLIDAPAATGSEPITVVQQDDRSVEHEPRAARLSADGRYVAFASFAPLVAADRNRIRDVYVMDLWTRRVTIESQGSNDTPADGESLRPDISSGGRFVVFESVAGNLLDRPVPSGISRVYLRDRVTGTIRLISAAADAGPADAYSSTSAISADGTTIVFASAAANLPGECQSPGRRRSGLYLIRLSDGVCARVDVSSAGIRQDQESAMPSVSGDGRYVAFMSRADLTCGDRAGCPNTTADRNGLADIYVRDSKMNLTVRVSHGQSGRDTDGPSYQPSISTDGRFVVFVSEASNLVPGARIGVAQAYIHDLPSGTTELVSHTPRGRPGNGRSLSPAVARDGLTIAFQSHASDLVCELDCPADGRDINLLSDVFIYDRRTRHSIRVSGGAGGQWMEYSRAPALDESGRVVAFASPHPIGERDQAHDEDLYVALMAEPPSLTGAPGAPVLDVPVRPAVVSSPVDRRSGLR